LCSRSWVPSSRAWPCGWPGRVRVATSLGALQPVEKLIFILIEHVEPVELLLELKRGVVIPSRLLEESFKPRAIELVEFHHGVLRNSGHRGHYDPSSFGNSRMTPVISPCVRQRRSR
jgi:hypothetical protein